MAAAAPPRVIVVGGGFAGVACARTLLKRLGGRRKRVEVVLFDRENHLVFQPLLAEVVGSALDPNAVAAPLRQLIPGAHCRNEEIQAIDLERRVVSYHAGNDRGGELAYDHLVLACGGIANLTILPGMADHGFPLRTVGDAIQLRAHVLGELEEAEVCTDHEQRRRHLSFVVVGGGYSGVEAAGEINDLVRDSCRFYPHVGADEVTVTLVHSGAEILPEISPTLRGFAAERMRRAGVTLALNSRVAGADADGVALIDGRRLNAGTIVCTIGGAPAPLIERLGLPLQKGRLPTDADLRLQGQAQAWAIGDCAWIINAIDGQPCAPTGQFAERQGTQCARNIERVLAGEPTLPFAFRPLGQLCAIGGHRAVAELFGLRLGGFLAWFVWRGVYLSKLPHWSRRAKVGLEWAWDLLFPRDLTLVRVDTTERTARLVFADGAWVFRAGDPATTFYVITAGEAEVVAPAGEGPLPGVGGDGEVLAVLGPNQFFGERALAEKRPRRNGVRARGRLEVIALSAATLHDLARRLPPLEAALRAAIAERSKRRPELSPRMAERMRGLTAGSCVQPYPEPHLAGDAPLAAATALLADPARALVAVVDAAGAVIGTLTAESAVLARLSGFDERTPLAKVMTAAPPPIAASVSLASAAEHLARAPGLLPVVDDDGRPAGYLDRAALARTMLAAGTSTVMVQRAVAGRR